SDGDELDGTHGVAGEYGAGELGVGAERLRGGDRARRVPALRRPGGERGGRPGRAGGGGRASSSPPPRAGGPRRGRHVPPHRSPGERPRRTRRSPAACGGGAPTGAR